MAALRSAELLLTQGATQSPALPFWLQIVAISLAPALGFVGVAIGALLKDRSDRRQALMAERRSTYSDYAGNLEAYLRFMGMKGPGYLRKGGDRMVLFRDTSEELEGKLIASANKVMFFGSTEPASIAAETWLLIAQLALARIEVMKNGFNREAWNEAVGDGIKLSLKFSDAALGDLGIPKKERARRGINKSRGDDEMMLKITQMGKEIDERDARQASAADEESV
ncbi:hypothetical protein [Amycolatopsis sp. NPDC059021]|uniref:hypothetical protein n=1 Tax=Amycolatopsis sp. NPDC059021 TaxID=3346704 RepID=UPI003671A73C